MNIYLRPITIEDSAKIIKWRNSLWVKNHCFDKSDITEESNRIFFEKNILSGKYKQFIVERMDEEQSVASYAIASVYLKDIDDLNHRCELCIFTSPDEEWNSESQIIAINMLLDKAFKEYNMHKVYSYVFADNQDEVMLLAKSGFRIEATLIAEALDNNNKYCDVYRMCVVK